MSARKAKAMTIEEALAVLDALPPAPPCGRSWDEIGDVVLHIARLESFGPKRVPVDRPTFDGLVAEARAELASVLEIVAPSEQERVVTALQVATQRVRDLEEEDCDLTDELAGLVAAGTRSTATGWHRRTIERHEQETAALRAHVAALRAKPTRARRGA
jgi:hypothetical protein